MPVDLVPMRDLAAAAGVSLQTCSRWLRAGAIKATRGPTPRARWRIERNDAQAFLASLGCALPPRVRRRRTA